MFLPYISVGKKRSIYKVTKEGENEKVMVKKLLNG